MASENKIVKIGMMSFAHGHAYGYAGALKQIPNAEIVGIADEDKERGLAASKTYETTCFGSYAELLKQDIDAVIVCSENVNHKDLTVMAAEAKKHVMCEKPLAASIKDGRAMIAACKKNGVELQTAFPCRYSPAIIQARDGIRAGGIGNVFAIKATNQGSCPGGWFTDLSLSGGGAVIDHTVHVADLILWTLDAEVTEVYAEISNLMMHKNFDDTGVLTLKLDNGVFATLDSSWSRPPSYPYWGNVKLAITGTEGQYNVDQFNQIINVYNDRKMRHYWEHWGDNFDLGLCRGFVDAIANGTPVPITGEDGLAAASVALAAYESAKTGKPVKVADLG
jgi:myo-inositol 2-dehydrogenase / D-chiro-inositol 1-dehydrogenase